MNTPVHDPDIVLAFLKAFIAEHNYPPSYREIMEGCGLSSTSIVGHHLDRLQLAGKIRREFNSPRTIAIIGGEE